MSGRPKAALPFGPLRDYIASLGVQLNIGGGTSDDGLGRLGWHHDNRSRQYHRGQQTGFLTNSAADDLAVSLGVHPCEIWGQAWWTAQTTEAPARKAAS